MRSAYYSLPRERLGLSVQLAELLGALSHALDMTEGQPKGHCIRSCWIGMHVGNTFGLSNRDLSDLFFTLLLKDLGCSSNAARICELYLADDILFKRDFKTIDGTLNSTLRFVFDKTGLEAGLSERLRAIVNILRNGGEISRSLIETRCHRGADIASKMRFSTEVQDGIRSLDEHWDGSGKPLGLERTEVPVISNIALLAQVIDIFHTESGPSAALNEARARSGSWFNPELVAAFETTQEKPMFWDVLASDQVEAKVLQMEPALQSAVVDDDYLDEIAAAFSDVVDAKSPYTADHSRRVALYSDMISEELGLSRDHRRWLRRAALLHDLGKLSVSNQILDKPDKLTNAEFEVVKLHPYHSECILKQISVFQDIAPVAGAHHERLDGKGYPCGLSGEEICLETRILSVADVFDALSAERPYRPAMPVPQAMSILENDIDQAFDRQCVEALKLGLTRLNEQAA